MRAATFGRVFLVTGLAVGCGRPGIPGTGDPDPSGNPSIAFQDRIPDLGEDVLSSIEAVVAWQDSATNKKEIYVKTLQDGVWTELDGSASGFGVSESPGTDSKSPAVVRDAQGNIAVAWIEDKSVLLRYWDGSSWTELGNSADGNNSPFTQGDVFDVAIAMGTTGPIVTWSEKSDGGPDIYVRAWTGEPWQALGDSTDEGGISDTGRESRRSVRWLAQ